jgi:UDP-N-acetylglucosamine 4,6-dehydratase
MPAMKLKDLTDAMIEELSTKLGFDKDKIKIKEIGIRPGEKLHEELIGDEENNEIKETGDMFIILPKIILPFKVFETPPVLTEYKHLPSVRFKEYSSKVNLVSKEEVRKFLKRENLL